MEKKTAFKTIAENRAAGHEHFILETFEAGIELIGTEVKSIRARKVNLKDAWVSTDGRQIWVKQMHISPYEQGNIWNADPLRERRLLMHKPEIARLFGHIKRDGYTLIPLSLYFKGSNIKVKVGLCKGKKLHDKRQSARERDLNREINRTVRVLNK